jgi:hypothetical protein
MAAEQVPADDQDLQALHQQAIMEAFVEQDMARFGISAEDVAPGAFQRIAEILLSRERPSSHNYHAGGRGVARPDYSRGDDE